MIMGGGPDAPSRQPSSEKQLVLCTLPWPQERAEKGIAGLKEEFKDVEVKYYYTQWDHGKLVPIEIPEGEFSTLLMVLLSSFVLQHYWRSGVGAACVRLQHADRSISASSIALQYWIVTNIHQQTRSLAHRIKQHFSGFRPMLKLLPM